MESNHYPLKPRHYEAIPDLVEEDERDISPEAMKRRCLGISILEEYMAVPSNPQLMPSTDGILQALVFTIPAYAFRGEHNPIRKVYQDLLLKLPAHTSFYILAHEQITEELTDWLRIHNLLQRTTLHAVPERYEMTIWAEDSFELVHNSNNQALHLVQPHSHRRTSDGNIGYQAAKAFKWSHAKVPLHFEGGNMLVGDDFFLLGVDHAIDTYRDWSGDLLESEQAMGNTIAELYRKYLESNRVLYFVGCAMQLPAQRTRKFTLHGEEWEEILYLKNGEGTLQPIFHIDMFITLAGRNSKGKYQVVVGDTRSIADTLGHPYQLALPDAFDEIAETLSRIGFEVVRNPLPLVYVDDPAKKQRKWYWASYNNALVEITPEGRKTIWLPTYGHGNWPELKTADEENKRIWEELGFNVVMLEDFHPFAENAGAAHCIKKYIRQ
ncbi:MAG TPA: hypothetical protein VIG72_05160 [Pontibacter sp.]